MHGLRSQSRSSSCVIQLCNNACQTAVGYTIHEVNMADKRLRSFHSILQFLGCFANTAPGQRTSRDANNRNTLEFTQAVCLRAELAWWQMLEMAELGVAGRYSGEGEENLGEQWLEWGQSLPQALWESPVDKSNNDIHLPFISVLCLHEQGTNHWCSRDTSLNQELIHKTSLLKTQQRSLWQCVVPCLSPLSLCCRLTCWMRNLDSRERKNQLAKDPHPHLLLPMVFVKVQP